MFHLEPSPSFLKVILFISKEKKKIVGQKLTWSKVLSKSKLFDNTFGEWGVEERGNV
jgi:hypothetical protein